MEEASLKGDESNIEAANETPAAIASAITSPSEPLKKPRQWSFQPSIRIRVVTHTIALRLNPHTGCMEATEPLVLNQAALFQFLKGISDGELQDLQDTLETLSVFVPVENFSVSHLTLDKCGSIHFEIHINGSCDTTAGATAGLSLEHLEVTVSRTTAPNTL